MNIVKIQSSLKYFSIQILTVYIILTSIQSTPTNRLKDDWTNIQEMVHKLANKTLNSYYQGLYEGCSSKNSTSNNYYKYYLKPKRSCSWHSCLNTFPELTCDSRFNNTNCKSCPGIRLNKQFSNLINIENRNDTNFRFVVKATNQLDEIFLENYNDQLIYWQYFISTTYGIRIFPYSPICRVMNTIFDDDFPWVISSVFGERTILIIHDSSKNMRNIDVLLANSITKSLVEITSRTDLINIVSYHNEARFFTPDFNVNNVTERNYTSFLDSIYYTDNFDLNNVLMTTFDYLKAQVKSTLKNKGHIYVYIITAGIIYLPSSASTLYGNIELFKEKNPEIIFSISVVDLNKNNIMISNLNSILRELTCLNSGLYVNISNFLEIYKLELLFHYMRIGNVFENASWKPPHMDNFGLGKVMAISKNVYDFNRTPPFLLGLVGIEAGYDEDKATKKKLNSIIGVNINRLNLTECQIDQLREYKCQNSDYFDKTTKLNKCNRRLFRIEKTFQGFIKPVIYDTSFYFFNINNYSYIDNDLNDKYNSSLKNNYLDAEKIPDNVGSSQIYILKPENLTEIIWYFKNWPLCKGEKYDETYINNIYCHLEKDIISSKDDELYNKDLSCCSYCGVSIRVAIIIPSIFLGLLLYLIIDLLIIVFTNRKMTKSFESLKVVVSRRIYTKYFCVIKDYAKEKHRCITNKKIKIEQK